jgi:hypothetical protein
LGVTSRLFIGAMKTCVRRSLRIKRPHVLIACMPKSASTFLTDCISGLPGMRRGDLAWTFGGREQVLDPIQLARQDLRSYVAQQHLRYSADVGELIQDFKLLPVVLTRDIFDVVVSLRDHYRALPPGSDPMLAPIGLEQCSLADADFDDLLADLVIPWYINFFVSWDKIDCVRVTYDQVREDPLQTIARICAAARINIDNECVMRSIEFVRARGFRFNKGISGRGRNISPYARKQIISFARHYPGIDFREIGIE